VKQGTFLLVTSSIFALIALLHAVRLVYGGGPEFVNVKSVWIA